MVDIVGNRRGNPITEFESNVFGNPVVYNKGRAMPPKERTQGDAVRDINGALNDMLVSQADNAKNLERLRAEVEERRLRRELTRMDAEENPPPPDPNGGMMGLLHDLVIRDQRPAGESVTLEGVARLIDEKLRLSAPAADPLGMVRSAFELVREATSMTPTVAPAPQSQADKVLVQMQHDQLMEMERLRDEREERSANREMEMESRRQAAESAKEQAERINYVLTDVAPKVMEMLQQERGGGLRAAPAPEVLVPDAVYSRDVAPFACPSCGNSLVAIPSRGVQTVPCPNCASAWRWSPVAEDGE